MKENNKRLRLITMGTTPLILTQRTSIVQREGPGPRQMEKLELENRSFMLTVLVQNDA